MENVQVIRMPISIFSAALLVMPTVTWAASRPAITGISPSNGPAAGGTTVQIQGRRFASGALVSFGGVGASRVTFVSSGTIYAVTPPHLSGAVSVMVTNPNGSFATLNNAFTYTDANPGLSVTLSIPSAINEGSAATFSAVVSGASSCCAVSYQWTFGDYSYPAQNNASTVSHTYQDSGSYTVGVSISQSINGVTHTARASSVITVNNLPPIVNANGPYSGRQGEGVYFSASASDPSSSDQLAGLTIEWDFGDGGHGSGAQVVHTYTSSGTYAVQVTATDKDGSKATALVFANIAATCSKLLASSLASSIVSVSPSIVSNRTQTMVVPRPSGGVAIAWTASNCFASYCLDPAHEVHITWVDSSGKRAAPDTVIPINIQAPPAGHGEQDHGMVGFAATPEGYGVLVNEMGSLGYSILTLVRINEAGQITLRRTLFGGCDVNTDDYCAVPYIYAGTGGQLLWTGNYFAAYVGILYRHLSYTGTHQMDTFRSYSADGTELAKSITRCSHSLARSLAWNGVEHGRFCLTEPRIDYLPNKFAYYHVISADLYNPDWNISLGEAVPVSDGFLLNYTFGVDSKHSELGFTHVSNTGAILAQTWLTNTPELLEEAPHLAPYGGHYVAAWETYPEGKSYLARVDLTGKIVSGPEPIPMRVGNYTRDVNGQFYQQLNNFSPQPNGDVVWALSDRDPTGSGSAFTVTRLLSCY